MGEYFTYANHDKKLKFDISLNTGNVKFSGIGYAFGTRAFCLLLTESKDYQKLYSHTLIGSWIGDQTEWHYPESSYQDITANIILMLYQIDGTERLIEIATQDDHFFVQLAYLIFTKQLTDFVSEEFVSEFEQNFGTEWAKKYKTILETHSYYRVYDLILMLNSASKTNVIPN